MRAVALVIFLASVLGVGATNAGTERNPVRESPRAASDTGVRNFIVKLRGSPSASAASVTAASTARSQAVRAEGATVQEAQIQAAQKRVAAVAGRAGLTLTETRSITSYMHVMRVDSAVSGESAAATLARLRSDPDVEYAEIDQRRYAHAVPAPNDPLFVTDQWYLQNSSATPAAIDAVDAWNLSTGSPSLVIADLDTGVRFDHPDLLTVAAGGRLLPGYNFISDAFVANNGGAARGPDASDPGDWVTQADLSQSQCKDVKQAENSSWHGTRTAGLLGAITNNNAGIAGVTWQTQILPVRVLGKCGGSDSDIVAAMLWAAGISVAGVPDNTHPARVINMSLGGTGSCPQAYTDVIGQVTARGALVVVSAGNEGGPVDVPANCPGVAGVAGIRHVGTKVGYSNLGPEVSLAAPAGNCGPTSPPCLYPITSTTNAGTTTPVANSNTFTDRVNDPNTGTSFSAPLVSGIGALMAAVNGNLNSCQLISRLKEGTLPFPQSSSTTNVVCHDPTGASDLQGECVCTLDGKTCGAGMANAFGALKAAQRPIAAVSVPSTVTAGQSFTLQASGSAAANGRSIGSYSWANPSGTQSLTIQGASTATATVTPPSCGLATVRLTVTDSAGSQDTADIVVSPTAVSTMAVSTAMAAASCSVTPPAVQVAVCPASQGIQVGSAATAFTATTAYTSSTAVTWEVNGVAGGNSTVGTITSTGMYTPPANVPTPATITITAVSAADASASGSADVTLTSPPSRGGGGRMDWATLIVSAWLLATVARRRLLVHRG